MAAEGRRAPEALARICDRAMALEPDDRYATAQEMHDALQDYLDGEGGHTSAREVGKFVAEKFAEDRAKVKAMIESQLKDIRWSGAYPKSTAVDLPKIDPEQRMITPTNTQRVESGSSSRSGSGQVSILPSSSDLGRSSGSLTNAASLLGAPPSAKRHRPVALIAVGAVVAAGVFLLGLRFFAPGSATTPGTQVTQATSSALAIHPIEATAAPHETALTPAPGQDAVKLTVHVTPANAKIYLDDALLSAGHFEGKLVKSDTARRLRVEAAHYLSKEETVTLTGDVMLSFSLEREAPGVAPGTQYVPRGGTHPTAAPEPQVATVAAPPPVPVPVPAPAPAPTNQKPKRAIDSDSPYAQ
jgi:hypothetical protein